MTLLKIIESLIEIIYLLLYSNILYISTHTITRKRGNKLLNRAY